MKNSIIDFEDPKIAKALDEWIKKSEEMFPTTLVNGRRVPICRKCGRITDMSPAGSHDCQHCKHEFVKDMVFTS